MNAKRFLPIRTGVGRVAIGLAVLFAGVLGAALTAGTGLATAAPPNILLITADDLGMQVNAYGDKTQPTPNIDRIGREGVRFTNAYVTQSSCSSSRSSIFTGTYPHQNGQIGLQHWGFAMAEPYPTLSSILHAAGYRTGVIGKVHVGPANAFWWDFRSPYETWPYGTRDVRLVRREAKRFLATVGSRPFFLKVSLLDPHDPYIDQVLGLPAVPLLPSQIGINTWSKQPVPDEFKPMVAAYYNALRRADIGVGLLLSLLVEHGKRDNTMVIFLSDNGGGPVQWGKMDAFEAGLRVPMAIRYPAIGKAGQVRHELVSTVDLLPTILQAAHVACPAITAAMNTEGRSLLPIIRGETPAWRQYLFAEMNYHTPDMYVPIRTVRDSRYKLMHAYPPLVRGHDGLLLFDLQNDSHEHHDLATDPAHQATLQRLLTVLEGWQTATHDFLPIE